MHLQNCIYLNTFDFKPQYYRNKTRLLNLVINIKTFQKKLAWILLKEYTLNLYNFLVSRVLEFGNTFHIASSKHLSAKRVAQWETKTLVNFLWETDVTHARNILLSKNNLFINFFLHLLFRTVWSFMK